MKFSDSRSRLQDCRRLRALHILWTGERNLLSFPRREHEFQFPRRCRELVLHLPPTPGTILPRRKRDVVLAHQQRRHEPQLRERQVLPHARETSDAEGGEGAFVGDHFRHGVPTLGHELGGTGKRFVNYWECRTGV